MTRVLGAERYLHHVSRLEWLNKYSTLRIYVLARRSGDRQLEERMRRDYDGKQPTCPACGSTTHLAHIHLSFFEDVAIASPALKPADDVPATHD